MNDIEKYSEETFESIKHIDENGNEYWRTRELAKVLKYSEYRKFNKTLNKSIEAC